MVIDMIEFHSLMNILVNGSIAIFIVAMFITLPLVFLWLGWRFPPPKNDATMKIYFDNEIE